MLAANQRIWGFETNYGGLAELSVVEANQLMPKPAHLYWEEAAVNALCGSTAYRMLVGPNAAGMKQGDIVFIWGAVGGIGGYATQLVLNGGGIPIGVVSSPDKVDLLRFHWACDTVIDRAAEGYRFWSDPHTQDEGEWRRPRRQDPLARRCRPRHRLRAPRALDDGRLGVRLRSGRHLRHLRRHQRLHGRVTTTATCG